MSTSKNASPTSEISERSANEQIRIKKLSQIVGTILGPDQYSHPKEVRPPKKFKVGNEEVILSQRGGTPTLPPFTSPDPNHNPDQTGRSSGTDDDSFVDWEGDFITADYIDIIRNHIELLHGAVNALQERNQRYQERSAQIDALFVAEDARVRLLERQDSISAETLWYLHNKLLRDAWHLLRSEGNREDLSLPGSLSSSSGRYSWQTTPEVSSSDSQNQSNTTSSRDSSANVAGSDDLSKVRAAGNVARRGAAIRPQGRTDSPRRSSPPYPTSYFNTSARHAADGDETVTIESMRALSRAASENLPQKHRGSPSGTTGARPQPGDLKVKRLQKLPKKEGQPAPAKHRSRLSPTSATVTASPVLSTTSKSAQPPKRAPALKLIDEILAEPETMSEKDSTNSSLQQWMSSAFIEARDSGMGLPRYSSVDFVADSDPNGADGDSSVFITRMQMADSPVQVQSSSMGDSADEWLGRSLQEAILTVDELRTAHSDELFVEDSPGGGSSVFMNMDNKKRVITYDAELSMSEPEEVDLVKENLKKSDWSFPTGGMSPVISRLESED
ncbi:hypothetical protein EDC01DRAFT_755846 [Geopyxis carbonaria]|nr:hypothetical protein EDC01DRAFT_755846 [Geopyxis carbonaria]